MIGDEALVPPKTVPAACRRRCRRPRRRCSGRRPRRRRRRCALRRSRCRCLPGRLGVVRRAAGAGAAPRRLGPAAGAGVPGQRGAADRGDVRDGGRVLHAVAAVAGARGDRHARVVEVDGVGGSARPRRRRRSCWRRTSRPARPPCSTAVPRLADGWPRSPRPAGCGSSGRSPRPCRGRARSRPAQPVSGAGQGGAAGLVDLAEAAVRGGARRQAVLASGRRPGRTRRSGRRRRRRWRRSGRRRRSSSAACRRSAGRPGRSPAGSALRLDGGFARTSVRTSARQVTCPARAGSGHARLTGTAARGSVSAAEGSGGRRDGRWPRAEARANAANAASPARLSCRARVDDILLPSSREPHSCRQPSITANRSFTSGGHFLELFGPVMGPYIIRCPPGDAINLMPT